MAGLTNDMAIFARATFSLDTANVQQNGGAPYKYVMEVDLSKQSNRYIQLKTQHGLILSALFVT